LFCIEQGEDDEEVMGAEGWLSGESRFEKGLGREKGGGFSN